MTIGFPRDINAAIAVHRALTPGMLEAEQLVTYVKQSGCKVGLVRNFNVKWLTAQGILRRVHDFPE